MADASVAPKERVNIVYKPATEGAKAEVELPNKLLVLGDFTGRADETPVEDRERISINKDNFDDVLKGQNISLDIAVPSRLSDDPATEDKLSVHLDIKSLKDFTPDEIAKNVPELNALLELREALKALRGPLANVPNFRKKIQELVKDDSARAKLIKALNLEEK
ncbi:MAG: type VI secretion system contractile sheath small subunit [Deltaproteobacteria bacterium]|jgi:type VI secretion system protein ImpB|nr:type VI secretion system contractile sheath small subunit [Deltaproteobacteria bacterium]